MPNGAKATSVSVFQDIAQIRFCVAHDCSFNKHVDCLRYMIIKKMLSFNDHSYVRIAILIIFIYRDTNNTVTTETWAKLSLQSAIDIQKAAAEQGGKATKPCSLCFYLLDACYEFLNVKTSDYNAVKMTSYGIVSKSSVADNLTNVEIPDGYANGEIFSNGNEGSPILCVPSSDFYNASPGTWSRSSSIRSRMSSYSSLTISSLEDIQPASREQDSVVSKNMEAIQNESLGDNSERHGAGTSIQGPVVTLDKNDNLSDDIFEMNKGVAELHVVEPSQISTENCVTSGSKTSPSDQRIHIDVEVESIPSMVDNAQAVDNYIPEEDDCEVFDQYMREIYATNICETFDDNRTPKQSNVINNRLENNNKNSDKCISIQNNKELNNISESKKCVRKPREDDFVSNILSPSLKSIWNVIKEKEHHPCISPKQECKTLNKTQDSDTHKKEGKNELTCNTQNNIANDVFSDIKDDIPKLLDNDINVINVDGTHHDKNLMRATRGTNTEPEYFTNGSPTNHCCSVINLPKMEVTVNTIPENNNTKPHKSKNGGFSIKNSLKSQFRSDTASVLPEDKLENRLI